MQTNDADIVWEFGGAVVFVFLDEYLSQVIIRYQPFLFEDSLIADDMLDYFVNGLRIFENSDYTDILYVHPVVDNLEQVVNSLILNINKLAEYQDEWDVFARYWDKIDKLEEILRD